MSVIHVQETVGQLVARRPALSRVLEEAGIDYCCGGKRSLDEACRAKGIDPAALVAALQEAASAPGADESFVDAAAMSLAELTDHIEQTHHVYLRSELPRLQRLAAKVASVHGAHDERLRRVQETLDALAGGLFDHMAKEELILFPIIRRLEAGDLLAALHCGTVANPVAQMEMEHQDAGAALETLGTLTDRYTPPDWACNTYRALLDALDRLERDMHQHVHKEDNVLFPRAMRLEAELAERR